MAPEGSSGPSGVPDAVRRAVERTFQSTLGSAGSTRDRAQELVDDVLRIAEEGAARAGRGVRGVGRQADAASVTERLRDAIADRTFATREEARSLRSHVDDLADRVERLEIVVAALAEQAAAQATAGDAPSAARREPDPS